MKSSDVKGFIVSKSDIKMTFKKEGRTITPLEVFLPDDKTVVGVYQGSVLTAYLRGHTYGVKSCFLHNPQKVIRLTYADFRGHHI